MKKILLASSLALVLAGCGFTETGDAFRKKIAEEGARAYDEGLITAEWYLCSAASIGSIKRRYARSKETADAYRALCNGSSEAEVIEVEELPEPE